AAGAPSPRRVEHAASSRGPWPADSSVMAAPFLRIANPKSRRAQSIPEVQVLPVHEQGRIEPANPFERIEPDGHRAPRHGVDPSVPFVDDADSSIQDFKGSGIEGGSAAVDDPASHGRQGG